MILEGIVTSLDAEGRLNIAPMGPIVDESLSLLRLRPFRSSQTYANLKQRPYGVFHVVDDVLLLARAAIGRLDPAPETFPAQQVAGRVIAAACRWYEFEVVSCDDSQERVEMQARVVHQGRLRDFFGFHRARHAVLEAAILATRVHILPREEILAEFARLRIPVEKTAGPREREAFALLQEHVQAPCPAHTQQPPQQATVTTGARLHCGLFAPGAGPGRRYGGLGLMVSPPGFVVRATAGDRDEIVACEPWKSRAGALVMRYRDSSPREYRPPPCRLDVVEALPAHAGLGSGTQFGLAVACALAALAGESVVPAVELARRAGRGARSAVGLHGFAHGGLLVEGGKSSPDEISPLIARVAIPESWRFVLACPQGATGLSGTDEVASFSQLPTMSAATTDRLCQLTLRSLLPAFAAEQFGEASDALYEIGRTVGEYFAPVQGGIYAHARMIALVARVRQMGYRGVSQTSWGPTLFVLCPGDDAARKLVADLSADATWHDCDLTIATPLNRGATVTLVSVTAAIPTLSHRPPE